VKVPWWLRPWGEVLRLRRAVDYHANEADRLAEGNNSLAAKLRVQSETVLFLEAELRRLAGTERGAMLSTQKPDWVLVGIPRPGVGVRVWASRELSGTAFDMTPMDQPPPRWKITATMAQALTVDEPDYGAAMAKVTQIWHNWDAEAARTETRAHPVARPQVTAGRAMLTRGGDDDDAQEPGRP
jgi:hypothetical protein